MIASTYLFYSKQSVNHLLNFDIDLIGGDSKSINFSCREIK